MESTLTPEEAGVEERLAMHIADNVDTDDFQTKNDSISCKLAFIMSLLENLIPVKSPCSNLFPDTQDAKSHSGYEWRHHSSAYL
ncbi:hypothetical protein DY000_02030000 [Brassica cretica]|uniref:Uncharacterized protein n=1 Tax=Brassica cretica TaxID=69181 RepID=A0ABQ7DHB3_BRACR|nr:hypothetical protein DY000_02030000 [Brassica cretica]